MEHTLLGSARWILALILQVFEYEFYWAFKVLILCIVWVCIIYAIQRRWRIRRQVLGVEQEGPQLAKPYHTGTLIWHKTGRWHYSGRHGHETVAKVMLIKSLGSSGWHWQLQDTNEQATEMLRTAYDAMHEAERAYSQENGIDVPTESI